MSAAQLDADRNDNTRRLELAGQDDLEVLRCAIVEVTALVYDHLDYDTPLLHRIARTFDTPAVRVARGLPPRR